MAVHRGIEEGVLVLDPGVDGLHDTLAARRNRHDIGRLLHGRQGIADRDRAPARPHEREIVLGVSGRHDVVGRQAEVFQRRPETRGLVDAVRQHHHGAFVENNLKVEPERPDGVEDCRLVGFPRGHDDAPDRERLDAEPLQMRHEGLGRRRTQGSLLLCAGRVEQRSILGHDAVEQVEPRAGPLEIWQFPARHHHQAPAGLLQPLQGRDGRLVDDAVMGDRAIVIGGERAKVMHDLHPRRTKHPVSG